MVKTKGRFFHKLKSGARIFNPFGIDLLRSLDNTSIPI